jgi:hypothetical protein
LVWEEVADEAISKRSKSGENYDKISVDKQLLFIYIRGSKKLCVM